MEWDEAVAAAGTVARRQDITVVRMETEAVIVVAMATEEAMEIEAAVEAVAMGVIEDDDAPEVAARNMEDTLQGLAIECMNWKGCSDYILLN